MGSWLRLARGIDRMSHAVGSAAAWLTVAMILAATYNAVVRYLGRGLGVSLSSNRWLELQWYLFSLVFLLGAASTLRHSAHVRVDAVHARLSPRKRAWINLLGGIFFLLPFAVAGLWLSWPSVQSSWRVHEMSPDPGGLPRYPIKAVVLVAFALLLLQGVADVIHQVARLRGIPGEGDEPPEARGEGI